MKKMILATVMATVFLCGCTQTTGTEEPGQTAPNIKEAKEQPTPQATDPPAIPAFEKEARPEAPPAEVSAPEGPMEFADTLIADYEVIRLEDFTSEFEIQDLAVEKGGEGYIFTGQKSKIYDTGGAKLIKPLEEYFDTPGNSYAVMIRFKSDVIDRLSFACDNMYDRIILSFVSGIYPATDIHGVFPGDPMLKDDWNEYIYEPGEWVYAFLSIADTAQRTCYIWPEDDPANYNYIISFGDMFAPPGFNFSMSENGETVTISDIWIFSYEEVKR